MNHTRETVYGASWLYTGGQAVDHDRQLRPSSWQRAKRIIKRLFLMVLLVGIGIGGWLGWKFYQDTSRLTGNRNPLSWLGSLAPTPLKTSNGRVNILLAGYSNDDPGHSGANLTDSIMIVSIDPANHTAVVISVPRDLWVTIPGYGYSKINAAYEYGEANGDGMGLLEKTVSQDFGVEFDYYALINYSAFRDAVNAVGGVTVTIGSPNPNGLYDPNANLRLPNGPVNLDGQTALNLARARGEGNGSYGFVRGDFDRTTHQQQLLVALKDKAASASVLANPFKVSSLADALGKNIKTDMSLGEMQTLVSKTKSINDSNITSVTLNNVNGHSLLASYYTYNGQSALIPADGITNYKSIKQTVGDLLATPASTN